MWATFKHLIGYENIVLDEDPIKARIKQAWLSRKYGKFQEAVDTLHAALRHEIRNANESNAERKKLRLATAAGTPQKSKRTTVQEAFFRDCEKRTDKEMVFTRIYDELANTYLEWGRLEEADKLFREVLVQIHKRKDQDPEFIGISLKLADIFAQRGDYINAEIGFVHCLEKQEKVVNELKKELKSKMVVMLDPTSDSGSKYTDPVALLGMVLEAYAHFLLAIPANKEL